MLSKHLKSECKVFEIIYHGDVNSINVSKQILSSCDAALKSSLLLSVLHLVLSYSHLCCSMSKLPAVMDGLLASAA